MLSRLRRLGSRYSVKTLQMSSQASMSRLPRSAGLLTTYFRVSQVRLRAAVAGYNDEEAYGLVDLLEGGY